MHVFTKNVHQAIVRVISRFLDNSISQLLDQPIDHSIGQSQIDQSMNHPVNQLGMFLLL